MVVASNVHGFALDTVELADDPAFVLFEVASDWRERFAKTGVDGLFGQCARPDIAR